MLTRYRIGFLSSAALLAVLAGCADSRQADSRPPAQDRCPGGNTRPLDVRTVVAVARRHGITLYNDPECQPDPTILAQASNILLYGPNTNIREQDEIMQQEGDVFCMVRAGSDLPRTAKRLPPEVRRIHYQGDEETHFSVFNVDCVIYPDPDHGKEQLRRLQQTMDELRKAPIGS